MPVTLTNQSVSNLVEDSVPNLCIRPVDHEDARHGNCLPVVPALTEPATGTVPLEGPTSGDESVVKHLCIY